MVLPATTNLRRAFTPSVRSIDPSSSNNKNGRISANSTAAAPSSSRAKVGIKFKTGAIIAVSERFVPERCRRNQHAVAIRHVGQHRSDQRQPNGKLVVASHQNNLASSTYLIGSGPGEFSVGIHRPSDGRWSKIRNYLDIQEQVGWRTAQHRRKFAAENAFQSLLIELLSLDLPGSNKSAEVRRGVFQMLGGDEQPAYLNDRHHCEQERRQQKREFHDRRASTV